MRVHGENDVPLVWFGVYDSEESIGALPAPGEPYALGEWRALVSKHEYMLRMRRIREYIASGDTYQVNFTYPMEAPFRGSAYAWFRELASRQPTDHGAFICTGPHAVASVSPERFFAFDGQTIETKPMKGTRPRGRFAAEDDAKAAELRDSAKDRAENVMIVDMVRNDLGRICRPGSVTVDGLCEVERLDTVWQMTSTIRGESTAGLSEIFNALFPSASVTGAPKIRTMEIINEIEAHPRGVYCGAVGWTVPGNQGRFSVAIRTATVDLEREIARYHVGGGVTWDSTAEGEYEECAWKAAVLHRRTEAFELLESIRFDHGYQALDLHLERLATSAQYFAFSYDQEAVQAALEEERNRVTSSPAKVRLLLNRDGRITTSHESAPLSNEIRVALAQSPVDSSDPFLCHKTTRREAYERARSERPEYDDVLLWNERGELTETTIANVAAKIGGRWYTPPVTCGLLPGTMRRRLLAEGAIRERVIHISELTPETELMAFNSVRGRMRCKADLAAAPRTLELGK